MYRNSKNSASDYHDMYRTYGFQMPLFNHPIPALQIYKAILTIPGETAGQLSLTTGPELWPRIARAHTTRTKRRTLRAALRNKDFRYYEYIVYISLVSIYFVIITMLGVIG